MLATRRPVLWAFAFLLASACLAPPGPAQRVTDAARELNVAARFGRMDVAVEHTATGARQNFLERRAEWGKNIRVLDVELAGMHFSDERNALIYVDVAWNRIDEGSLRSTRIAQKWRDGEAGWELVREQRQSGDLGLFGEPVPRQRRERRDVHFESKSIAGE